MATRTKKPSTIVAEAYAEGRTEGESIGYRRGYDAGVSETAGRLQDQKNEAKLKLINAMSQAIAANSNGLEAVSRALDNMGGLG